MEHNVNVNINGAVSLHAPDLIKAATIIASILQGSKTVVTEPTESIKAAMVQTPLPQGQDQPKATSGKPFLDDNGEYYEMFKNMTLAFDKLLAKNLETEVKKVLDVYSIDGKYGGVAPKDWGNAIKMVEDILASHSPAQISKPATLEECRAIAAQISKAGKRDILAEIFQSFGATKLSEIHSDKYGELLIALNGVV